MMDAPNEARLIADFPRTVPGAGSVGRAAIERNAYDRDIDLVRRGDRQPHERGGSCETRDNP
jgi:hypothetical protein